MKNDTKAPEPKKADGLLSLDLLAAHHIGLVCGKALEPQGTEFKLCGDYIASFRSDQ